MPRWSLIQIGEGGEELSTFSIHKSEQGRIFHVVCDGDSRCYLAIGGIIDSLTHDLLGNIIFYGGAVSFEPLSEDVYIHPLTTGEASPTELRIHVPCSVPQMKAMAFLRLGDTLEFAQQGVRLALTFHDPLSSSSPSFAKVEVESSIPAPEVASSNFDDDGDLDMIPRRAHELPESQPNGASLATPEKAYSTAPQTVEETPVIAKTRALRTKIHDRPDSQESNSSIKMAMPLKGLHATTSEHSRTAVTPTPVSKHQAVDHRSKHDRKRESTEHQASTDLNPRDEVVGSLPSTAEPGPSPNRSAIALEAHLRRQGSSPEVIGYQELVNELLPEPAETIKVAKPGPLLENTRSSVKREGPEQTLHTVPTKRRKSAKIKPAATREGSESPLPNGMSSRRSRSDGSTSSLQTAKTRASPRVVVRTPATPAPQKDSHKYARSNKAIRMLTSNTNVAAKPSAVKFLKKHKVTEADSLTDDFDMLCVAGDEPKTTAKLLLSLVLGKTIVKDEWITASIRAGSLVDPKDHVPSALSGTIDEDRSQLFTGISVVFTQKLRDHYDAGFEDMRAILGHAGANDVSVKHAREIEEKDASTIVIGLDRHDSAAMALIRKGHTCYRKELITSSILHAEMDLHETEFQLKLEPKVKREAK